MVAFTYQFDLIEVSIGKMRDIMEFNKKNLRSAGFLLPPFDLFYYRWNQQQMISRKLTSKASEQMEAEEKIAIEKNVQLQTVNQSTRKINV